MRKIADKKYMNLKCAINEESAVAINPRFTKAEVYILYTGENRNEFYLSDEAVRDAEFSLANIPIVGEFIGKNGENPSGMGSHGGVLELDDEGEVAKYKRTTVAYGVVPESHNARWVVSEKDGKEYYVCDAYLWTGEFPELEGTAKFGANQSMEIVVEDGDIGEDSLFHINKYTYASLCLLGQDVEPCFEEARVVAFSYDEFKADFARMMSELKECVAAEGNESKADEADGDIIEDVGDKATFKLTSSQIREKLSNALDKSELNEAYCRYLLVDYVSDEVIVSDNDDGCKFYGFKFSINGEDVVINSESKKRKKCVYIDLDDESEVEPMAETFKRIRKFEQDSTTAALEFISDGEIHRLETENAELKADLDKTRAELAKYETERKAALFEKFDEHISESDEYAKIKADSANMSFEDIEKACKFIVADSYLDGKLKKTVTESVIIKEFSRNAAQKSRYGTIN